MCDKNSYGNLLLCGTECAVAVSVSVEVDASRSCDKICHFPWSTSVVLVTANCCVLGTSQVLLNGTFCVVCMSGLLVHDGR